MLKTEQLSLARQMDLVFRELQEELSGLSSGTVFVQIRNNTIGKFGIRHHPLAGRGGGIHRSEGRNNGEPAVFFSSNGTGESEIQTPLDSW